MATLADTQPRGGTTGRSHSRSRPWRPPATRARILLGALVMFVLLAPYLAPHDPYQTDILRRLSGPGWQYPLGTDALGRCVLSRLLHGARLTPVAAFAVVAVSAAIGTVIGLLAGHLGGYFDRTAMRVVEGVGVLPALAVAIVIAGTLGLSLQSVLLALAAVHWTEYARVVRNVTIAERGRAYVLAAEAIGASGWRIMLRHLLPNVCGPLFVLGAYSLSWVILSFAGLSFLGLGVEPGAAEWGRMIAESRSHMREYPRLVLAPGLTIVAFVILVNLLGDMLADGRRVDRVTASGSALNSKSNGEIR